MVSETFTKITPAAFAAITAKIKAEFNAKVDGDTGTFSYLDPKSGKVDYTFTWNYVPAAQTLTIANTHKPLMIPDFLISAKMKELAAQLA